MSPPIGLCTDFQGMRTVEFMSFLPKRNNENYFRTSICTICGDDRASAKCNTRQDHRSLAKPRALADQTRSRSPKGIGMQRLSGASVSVKLRSRKRGHRG